MRTIYRRVPRQVWQRSVLFATSLLFCQAIFVASPPPARARGLETSPATATASSALDVERAAERIDDLPLAFEENRGQVDRRADFVARTPGGAVFVAPTEVGVVYGDRSKKSGIAVRLRYLGANARPSIEGAERLAGVVNYFTGSDPSRWRAGVATFAKVRVDELYPGIDLVYYGVGNALEYDLVVAPGADPSSIRFAVEGAARLHVDAASGDLVVGAGEHELRLRAPVLYQPTADGRREVAGRYVVAKNEVRFDVEGADASLPLVIDPIIYSTYIGGSSTELFDGVVVDGAGNAYLTGSTFSTDYPTTSGVFQGDQTNDDVVVTKLAPAGNALVYSTYLGGNASDFGNGIAIDEFGNATVTGLTLSSNFPTLNGFATDMANSDGFVTKLNATGSALLYSTELGGDGAETSVEIAAGAGGVVYVVGGTESSNFPTTANAFQQARIVAGLAPFVTKINTTLTGASSLVYSTYLGDLGQAQDVAVGATGVIYVTGQADGTMFPTTTGAFQGDQPGSDAFVTKLDTNMSGAASLVYSTYLGGNALDAGIGIAVDASGNAYVGGKTQSTNFPTTASAFQPTPPGSGSGDLDALVTKVNATGTALSYSTYLGGSNDDVADALALDSASTVYVTGETFSSDFPTASPIQGNQPLNDAYVTRISTNGSGAGSLLASTYLGGNDADTGLSIAVDGSNNVYVAGFTASTDFPTMNAFQGNQANIDAFVTKLSFGSIGVIGTDTVGVYDAATGAFFLKNSNSPGGADLLFTFGGGGAVKPIAGDWDGDGDDTVGLYDPASGAFFLRNSNSNGGADIVFTFGGGGALIPLRGDWDGDGDDTIGLYDPATGAVFLRNTNSNGGADLVFTFGGGGALVPLTGDWNNDGVDTIGLYDPATGAFFLRNSNSNGGADIVFTFGGGGATPLAGDWNGDGTDTIGLYIGATGTWFLRNTNASGGADLTFGYGPANFTPLTGDWDGN
jgi:hypothetical protein